MQKKNVTIIISLLITGIVIGSVTSIFFIQNQKAGTEKFYLVSFWFIHPLTNPRFLNYIPVPAFDHLSFNYPVGIYHAGDGTNRLFVLEQRGVIWVFNNSRNTTSKMMFLNISSQVDFGGEKGLLGLAFHPNYSINGYFFVDYTTSGPLRTIIARYKVNDSNPNLANLSSAFTILEIEQPFSNHNGGQIAFGPDNYLYIALGDGGSAGDPYGNAQNRSSLLGSILRIDVHLNSTPYSIPTDNPFYGNSDGYKEEIYAYGLRNPWRFSFDPFTGKLWAGDVGQNSWEEIDIVENGKNYGWNLMEGFHSYSSSSYNKSELELPIWDYSHALGHSITGGFVYNGTAFPELNGHYIYGDFETGSIWALNYDGIHKPSNVLLTLNSFYISSFGIDENHELYICNYLGGKIYRLREDPILRYVIILYFNSAHQNLQDWITYGVDLISILITVAGVTGIIFILLRKY